MKSVQRTMTISGNVAHVEHTGWTSADQLEMVWIVSWTPVALPDGNVGPQFDSSKLVPKAVHRFKGQVNVGIVNLASVMVHDHTCTINFTIVVFAVHQQLFILALTTNHGWAGGTALDPTFLQVDHRVGGIHLSRNGIKFVVS